MPRRVLHIDDRLRAVCIEWHTVGEICARVYAELESARGPDRFDGIRRIGIDETSYKKGRRYLTVVIGHDRGCLIWAHEDYGKDVLNIFLDEPTREQRRNIEIVTSKDRWVVNAAQPISQTISILPVRVYR